MSGGHWGYKNDYIAHELFGWGFSPDYGDEGFAQSKDAARVNPLEDLELSEMLWDLLCVLHSYDWYASGDTCEETYRKDVKRFKTKWLGRTRDDRIKAACDRLLDAAKDELYRTFGVKDA